MTEKKKQLEIRVRRCFRIGGARRSPGDVVAVGQAEAWEAVSLGRAEFFGGAPPPQQAPSDPESPASAVPTLCPACGESKPTPEAKFCRACFKQLPESWAIGLFGVEGQLVFLDCLRLLKGETRLCICRRSPLLAHEDYCHRCLKTLDPALVLALGGSGREATLRSVSSILEERYGKPTDFRVRAVSSFRWTKGRVVKAGEIVEGLSRFDSEMLISSRKAEAIA